MTRFSSWLCKGAILFAKVHVAVAATVTTVWQFPNETWCENLAVRHNGQILVTTLDRHALYQVDPLHGQPAILVREFDATNNLVGITEYERDVFAVASIQFTPPLTIAPGMGKIWKVDMRGFSSKTQSGAQVSLIANVTSALFPNGLTTLNSSQVLLADSGPGVVWRVDVRSGAYTAVLNDTALKPPGSMGIGVNGIHIHDRHLYFTNSYANAFGRVPIHADGTAAGPSEVIASTPHPDDFTILADGTAYVAGSNALRSISPAGVVTLVAGDVNSTLLVGATSVARGRTRKERGILYVSTNGGESGPVGGVVLPGKVAAVNVEV